MYFKRCFLGQEVLCYMPWDVHLTKQMQVLLVTCGLDP